MAFSTLLRTPGCMNRMFSQQVMMLATSSTAQRALATTVPAKILALQGIKSSTPITNAVRSFRTSPANLSGGAAAEKSHDHAKLWVVEKAVSAAMVPLIPLGLLMPNKLFDSLLAILITAHTFWGLEAIAVDYVRASIVGPFIPKVAIALVYLISIATLGGLFYIITHDIGLANTFKQLWAIKTEQKS